MSKELIERLSKHRPGKGDLDDEAADRIKQLLRRIEYLELCCDEGERQLAASQLREQQLREALSSAEYALDECRDYPLTYSDVIEALALPSDTTALEALIVKAGDVVVTKARQACIDLGAKGIDYFNYTSFVGAIDKLPTVTLEDLK